MQPEPTSRWRLLRNYPLWVSVLTFALGAALSAYGVQALRQQLRDAAALRFDRHAQELRGAIQVELSRQTDLLLGVRGLYAGSGEVSRAEFREFADAVNLTANFPAVNGLAVAEKVPAPNLDRWVARQRAEWPDFSVRNSAAAQPPAGGPDRYIVARVEPLARNRAVSGLDLSADAGRRSAIEQAIQSGLASLSAPLQATSIPDQAAGVDYALFVPIYDRGATPISPAERVARVRGFAITQFSARAVMARAAQGTQPWLDFELVDLLDRSAGLRVYDHDPTRAAQEGAAAGRVEPASSSPLQRRQYQLQLGGRQFDLHVASSPEFDATQRSTLPLIVGMVGLGGSLALAVGVWFTATARRRAEERAEAMTSDLDRLARVARSTTNVVVITDVQGRIAWVNDAFTRVTGYAPFEAMGQIPGRLLQCERTDPVTVARIGQAIRARAPIVAELWNRSKDGRDYWIRLDVQPLIGPQGELLGYQAIEQDITEEREASLRLQASLRETESLMRTVNLHAIVSETDARGVITRVNDAFTRISGYTARELIGGDHRMVNSGHHPSAFWREMWQTIQLGEPWRGEVCNRARDGSLYWVDSLVAPFTDETGRIVRYVSIRTDITERKRAQEQLQRAQRDLEHTNSLARIGTWEIDLQTDRLEWSAVTRAIFGVGPQYVPDVQTAIGFYREGEDRSRITRAVTEAIEQQVSWDLELRIVTAQGEEKWVRVIGTPELSDGQCLKLFGSMQDIDERVREREALRVERERLASILQGTHAGTWEWGVQDDSFRFDATWAELLGYSHDELAPRGLAVWQELTHPDDLVLAESLLQRHLAGDLGYYDCVVRMRHKRGHWVWIHDRGKAISTGTASQAPVVMGTHTDISDIKRTEAELRASQDFLERAERVAGVGGWSVDVHTGRFSWTRQAARLHDTEPDLPVSPGEVLELYDESHRDLLRQALLDSAHGGEPWAMEVPRTDARGHQRWMRVVAQTEWEEGRPARVVGAVQDVTETRELQQRLREANVLLQSVIDSIPMGLCVYDGQHRLVLRNAAYGEVLDLPESLLADPGMSFERLARFNAQRGEYGPGEVDGHVQALVEAARLPVRRHFERVRPNGDIIEARGAPLPDGGFVAVYANITEQRRTQLAVEQKERTLRGAIDAIDEAFVLYDPEDRLVFCNDKYRQYFPLSADLFVPGARFEDILRTGARRGEFPMAVGRIEEWLQERMARHRQFSNDFVTQVSSGRWIRVVERRTPDGYTVGFRIDITELKTAADVAEAASRSKSQFLANMSHEIRTPMNAVLGMLQLLRQTPLDRRQRDYADKTEAAARALLGLLNDILDFSKVEAGKLSLDPHPVELASLLDEVALIVSASVTVKPIELVFDLDPALPQTVRADDLRLRQVLVNLVGNAVKFTATGEIVVQMRQIARSAEPDGERVTVEVRVRDTGIGIAAEHQAHIFSGFSQAEASTTRRFGGTGLGLAISQRLVRLMGGELGVDSTPGVGSEFHFMITVPVEPGLAPHRSAPGASAGLEVLMVEPSSSVRGVLARLAETLGWNAHITDLQDTAQPILPPGVRPEVMFVGVDGAGVSGSQSLHAWRDQAERAGIPVVFMLTPHGRFCLEEAPGLGLPKGSGMLVKPVSARDLEHAALAALGRPVRVTVPATEEPARQPLKGLRLLVVEDNPVNQQVAQELLEDQGAEVELASNGSLGVAAVRRAAQAGRVHHVVLMDLQMPVMDGLEATRQIRQMGLHQLPIIAMTANAMPGDREVCLQAGMNDHIGKPFELRQLTLQILAQVRRAAALGIGIGTPDIPIAAAQPDPDAEAVWHPVTVDPAAVPLLDLHAAVARMSGNADLHARLTDQWLRDLPGWMQALGDLATGQGEPAVARRQLHTLKGTAATLGAPRLAQLSARIEHVIDQRGLEGLGAHWTALQDLVTQTRDALAELSPAQRVAAARQIGGPAELTGAQRAALQSELQQLLGLLRDQDLAALARVQRVCANYPAVAALPEARALDAAVRQFDFAQAVRCTQSLIDGQADPAGHPASA